MRKVEFVPEDDIEFQRYAVLEDGVIKGRLQRAKRMTTASKVWQLLMLSARRYWTLSTSLNGHTGNQGREWLSREQAMGWVTRRIVGRPE